MKTMTFNLARFDLISLRLAILCAELGSLSAAAKRANCSVSTASYRLTALEETLGVHLFTRDHRGLQVTRAGHLLAHHGREILQRLEVLNHLVSAESAKTEETSIEVETMLD